MSRRIGAVDVPEWLDDTAKIFWRRHYKRLYLTPEQCESFAVLCQTYSDYRQASDLRSKTKYLDFYYKLAKEFQLTPKTAKKPEKTPESTTDDFDAFK